MATEPTVIEAPARRFNPALIAGVGVLALILLVLLAMSLLGGSSSEEVVTSVPRPRVVTTSTATATAPPPETFEVFESKDPFRPLVAPPSTGGTSGTPAGTTVGTTGGGTTGTTGGTSTGGSTGSGGAPAPTGGERVQLVDIFSQGGSNKAQVKVGSEVFTVSVGQSFGPSNVYKLLSISGKCATLLHGDDKFTLCEGEEVFK